MLLCLPKDYVCGQPNCAAVVSHKVKKNDPALLPLVPEGLKTGSQTNIEAVFIAAHNSPKVETSKCPSTDEWINIPWCIHTMEKE